MILHCAVLDQGLHMSVFLMLFNCFGSLLPLPLFEPSPVSGYNLNINFLHPTERVYEIF